MNVPKLRFREFSGEWEEKKLGDIGKVSMCKRIMKDQTSQIGDIPFYKIGTFGKQADAFINQELYKNYKMKYSYPKKGDILIAASGATYGKIVVFDGSPSYFQDSNIVWIDNDNTLVYNSFLNIIYQKIQWTIEESTIPRLYNGTIRSTSLYTPSLSEQEKIASFLTSVDAKIEQLTKKKTLLEQYKKGVMQKIFAQEIRFSPKGTSSQAQGADDDGSQYPEWVEKKLGEVAECLDNLRKPLNDEERQKIKGNIPYWGANNIMDYVNDYLFDETIVLLAEDGGNFNEYKTRPIANLSHGKCWVNNHTHVLRGKNNILVNEYLFYSLVHKNITGFVSGGTRAKLTKGEMLKITIHMPTLKEQTKIANFLSSLDSKLRHVETQLNSTKQFKKALLQQMFV